MSYKKLILLAATIFFISLPVRANFVFDSINQTELDDISKELGANFAHSPVLPASSMGEFFGFEVGLLGGATKTPEIAKLVNQQDSSQDQSAIPHAGLMAAISIPFGISFEATMLPEIESDNGNLKTTSAALKWTFLRGTIFNAAARFHYATSEFSYTQTINNSSTGNTDVNSTISMDQTIKGGHLMASAFLFIIEAYAGYGFVKQNSDWKISASSNASIFEDQAEAKNSSKSSGHTILGLQTNFLLLHFGVEYNRMFDTDKYTAKVSIGF